MADPLYTQSISGCCHRWNFKKAVSISNLTGRCRWKLSDGFLQTAQRSVSLRCWRNKIREDNSVDLLYQFYNMDRRKFIRSAGLALPAAAILPAVAPGLPGSAKAKVPHDGKSLPTAGLV